MPAKRTPLRRPARRLPDAITRRLVADLPIERTEDNRKTLVAVAYFGADNLPPDVRQRAVDTLARWRLEANR